MSQLLYQYFLKKTQLDSVIAVGPDNDPYFEEIPDEDLHFYQHKGSKRKRKLPNYIPSHDLKILKSVKRKAYRLDLQLSCCGLRIGWSAIIGLLPWIGDLIAFALAMNLLKKASKIEGGLPPNLRLRMMANITFDFAIGLIPLVGDFINVLYKCNSRNFIILEKHLMEKYSRQSKVGPKEQSKHPTTSNRPEKSGYNKTAHALA
ncbi:uncharacterized protein PRCAT00000658001 [Priceomyces carsonii]|uniref:uncharacterized protein n=1 Tax=Priceomyces carsonii TaxID=28549 RepID=UPI002EDB2294|nr:unnamed protein product [Priceomyces carsonii]